ncbi:hypothetical protein JXQ31_04535 [candidate division KSB1 bacterium]|nr:hypothetical protein [candidate division KSB1 bacterium]
MKTRIQILLLILMPCLVFGQYKSDTGPVDISTALRTPVNAGKSALGILGLDPSRLDISQSYTMSYMSMGGQGISQGVYLNTMTYHFKLPMTLSFQWGMAHQPFAGSNDAPFLKSGPFISGAQFRYKPTENTVLEVEYSQNPYGYNSWYYNDRFRRY